MSPRKPPSAACLGRPLIRSFASCLSYCPVARPHSCFLDVLWATTSFLLLDPKPTCDALVSRDMFDRKQQNRSKCCPEIARDAATIGSVQLHTQAMRHIHNRIDRRKAVKERSPDQGRYKNFTALHLATMSRGEQEDEGPTTRRIIRTVTKSLTSQSHLISQILLLLFRLNQILPYTAVLAQTGSLVHV